ncbi:MAG: hypothetical protein H6659_18700 [Ardenticatenaceae bacterium]|nr:hypothetical protein [Ardenticatenaceae bacterium]MCB8987119.1 hypothetical protein [Ardenticatenaceae bacterium]
MSEQNQYKVDEVTDSETGYKTRREERLERRAARRADRLDGGLGWLGGVVLIALGLLFWLQSAGYLTQLTNWWALFILLPAVATFSAGMGAYRRNGGQWTGEAVGPMVASVMFLGLTAVFFFGLNLSLFGPILLIVAGLLLILGRR